MKSRSTFLQQAKTPAMKMTGITLKILTRLKHLASVCHSKRISLIIFSILVVLMDKQAMLLQLNRLIVQITSAGFGDDS